MSTRQRIHMRCLSKNMWYLNAQVGQYDISLGVRPVLCFQEYFQLYFIYSDKNNIRMMNSYEVSE